MACEASACKVFEGNECCWELNLEILWYGDCPSVHGDCTTAVVVGTAGCCTTLLRVSIASIHIVSERLALNLVGGALWNNVRNIPIETAI